MIASHPSQARWAYMKEIGRTRYVLTRTAGIMAVLMASNVLVEFLAGATVHSEWWLECAVTWLVLAPFVFMGVLNHWNQCEASAVLHTPTRHTPRFEGDLPPARSGYRKSA